MINRLRAAWFRFRLGVSPEDHILADYETLVRLARRCAYDFGHASDFIEMPDYLADFDYPGRARFWIALFAKGNPGKDYRNRIAMDLVTAHRDATELYELCIASGIEVPAPMHDRYLPKPF